MVSSILILFNSPPYCWPKHGLIGRRPIKHGGSPYNICSWFACFLSLYVFQWRLGIAPKSCTSVGV